MPENDFKRKLTAILSADAVGYSRMMRDDESSTIRTLSAYRSAMSNLIQEYKGRVVDAPGDNLLAEFGSVVDAVNCAVEIQRELAERNSNLPPTRRMEFRIGINLGDVIEEEGRIYGDGVNIAARLEGLAKAGGICISGTVYDQVENKLNLGYEFLGEHYVKNISKPVGVYRVLVKSDISVPHVGKKFDLPDKPSIIVLPFVNMSDDPKQEYFSDGITEEIITALAKVDQLLVIARNTTFTYKGKSVNIQHVGRELGVRYALEGSVRKADDTVRITAQLVDAQTGHHLWSERYDRDLKDIFALQDEITMKILMALQIKLTDGEQARLYGKGTENLEAYFKLLKGYDYLRRFNKESNVLARRMAEEAIAFEPEYPAVFRLLGLTHFLDAGLGWSESPGDSLERSEKMAQKALSIDDSDAGAHSLLGYVYAAEGKHDEAIAHGERAVALDPNASDNLAALAFILNIAGRSDAAVGLFKKVIRLDPIPSAFHSTLLGHIYRNAGRYEEAISELKTALHRNPDNLIAYVHLAASYGSLDRKRDSHAVASEIFRIDPGFSPVHFAEKIPYKKKSDTQRLINGLRKAGLK